MKKKWVDLFAFQLGVSSNAGKTGSLRSLHSFMAAKEKKLAARFNADLPSVTPVCTNINSAGKAEYRLIPLPLYMSGQLNCLTE